MQLEPVTVALLAGIILAAQTVETVTGFGATVIALALGVHLVSLPALVVTLVMIGIVQSSWIVVRGFRQAAWRTLLTRIIPICAVGLIAGRLFSASAGVDRLKTVLGGFVVAVASLELSILLRGARPPSPLPAPAGIALLAGGGFFHGVFASGGPLVVMYAGRAIPEKAAFRATLSVLWLVLNVALLATFAVRHEIDAASVRLAVWLLFPLAAGIGAGELIHRRVNETVFKVVVQSLLLATGIWLLI
ncbi:MAG: sulfite exporter TauE/SafE family protein [Deltaproteobacteria bacterium]|nr:sulfite exporter TauE/SafE family protein [Deltaproteobacteria bacterium]